jgi:FkbM family methyltransferase
LSRVSFDLALRNAIRSRITTDSDGGSEGTPRPEDQPSTKPKRGVKARLRKLFRSIAKRLNRPFRRRRDVTSEDLKSAIAELRSFVDAQMVNAHLKLDKLMTRSDQGDAKIVALEVGVDSAPKGIPQMPGALDTIARAIGNLQQAVAEAGNEAAAANMRAKRFHDEIGRKIDDVETKLHSSVQRLSEPGFQSWVPVEVDEKTLAIRVADGFVFVPKSDILLLLGLHGAGPYGLEPGTRRTIRRILAPGMSYIDVGAHIGLLTLAGARAVGEMGSVLAIEPTPETFELLSRTIAGNDLRKSVKALSVAAGSHAGRRRFHTGTVLGHNSFYRPEDHASDRLASEIDVDVARLDDLVSAGTRVDLVKIDAEGAELEILAGMRRIVAENPSMAIIAEFGPSHLARSGTTPQEWLSTFGDQGFEAWAIDESSGEVWQPGISELASMWSVNLMFVRPQSDPARRLAL